MEHRFRHYSLIIMAIWMLTACEKPLPEPELADPIYVDIRTDADMATKAVEDKRKEVEGMEASLEKPEVGDLERKHTRQQVFLTKKTISLMEQDVAYFKLRMETRKALDRETYPSIFRNKGKWPDQEEFERYKASKRLRGASRNWNDRVPKPVKPSTTTPKTEEKAEKKD